ncbi:hypothetical protein [Paenibacillus cymbidii]|uniref:hypothetical protein n=1 Tax=Paenibacillus cymbidii TaxID=1639034 RepID=UPI00107FF17F|nr:hypothetical protein [Paenibacillus cymbidii]
MATASVRCEFDGEEVRPFSLIVDFAAARVPWEQPVYWVQLDGPLPQQPEEDLFEGELTAAVQLEELVVATERDDAVGVSLASLQRRCAAVGCDWAELRVLVIRLGDLEEALAAGAGTDDNRSRLVRQLRSKFTSF